MTPTERHNLEASRTGGRTYRVATFRAPPPPRLRPVRVIPDPKGSQAAQKKRRQQAMLDLLALGPQTGTAPPFGCQAPAGLAPLRSA